MMLKRLGWTTALAVLGVTICTAKAQAQMEITVSGGWAISVGAADLTAGAGSDLNSTLESATDQSAISISNTSGASWRIDVKKNDISWHENLTMSERRTADGIGGGTILGGLSYIQLDMVDTQFFTGAGDLSNIPIQIKLQGISLQVPPSTYSTTITYTLVEIL